MRSSLCAILCLTSLLSIACASDRSPWPRYVPEPNSQHYMKFRWGAGMEVLTEGAPIDPARVPNLSCYRIIEDHDGRPVQIDFLVHGQVDPFANFCGLADRILISYEGARTTIEFVDVEGRPASHDGAFGYELTRDENGRTVSMVVLDEEGLPGSRDDGVSTRLWTWMPDGSVEVRAYGPDGDLVPYMLEPRSSCSRMRCEGDILLTEDFCSVPAAAVCYEADSAGRPTAMWAVDDTGAVVSTSDGYARAEYAYDGLGNLTSTRAYSADGALMPNCYDLAAEDYHPGNPRVDEEGYLLSSNLVAYTETVFDDDCNPVEWRNYDVHGDPVADVDGTSCGIVEYSPDGSTRTTTYYGRSGEVTGSVVQVFDEYERLLDWTMVFGMDSGSPEYFVRWRYEYETPGYSYTVHSLDRNGDPCPDPGTGMYATRYEVDQYDRILACEYLDENGNLCESSWGAARIVYSYDEEGRATEEELDINGNPHR